MSFKSLLLIECEPMPLLAELFSLLDVLNSNQSASLSLHINWVFGAHNLKRLRATLEVLSQHICGAIRREIPQNDPHPSLMRQLSPIVSVCDSHWL
jgi:hypothetical protein